MIDLNFRYLLGRYVIMKFVLRLSKFNAKLFFIRFSVPNLSLFTFIELKNVTIIFITQEIKDK